jgi:hypothetical protein
MDEKLIFKYDRAGDIFTLHVLGAEQETEELGDDVIALNPMTGEIENPVLFSTRLLRSDLFELLIMVNLHDRENIS